jgi:hypothetical protein
VGTGNKKKEQGKKKTISDHSMKVEKLQEQ